MDMAKIDAFFKVMAEQDASTCICQPGRSHCFRLQGSLKKVEYQPLMDEVLRPMLYEILTEGQIDRFGGRTIWTLATRRKASPGSAPITT